ncbi:MAG: hypothetical protein JW730_18290 [Anaerolineales bacterium]|nr:hypothetical protein [Anaerolineales bacterium]
MLTYIAIDKPVSAIQMDIRTSAQPVLSPTVTDKMISVKQGPVDTAQPPITSGYWRVIVMGLNQLTIQGRIIDVPGSVYGVTNVVGSAPDGTAVSVIVRRLSQPRNVQVSPQIQ